MEDECKKSKESWLQRTEQRLLERYHERLEHSTNRLSLNCQQMLQKKEGELADQMKEKADLRCRQVESQNAALGIGLEQEKVRAHERDQKLCELEATVSALKVQLNAKNAEIEVLNDQLETQAQRHTAQKGQIRDLQNRVQDHIEQAVVEHREAGPLSMGTQARTHVEAHAAWEQAVPREASVLSLSSKAPTPSAAEDDKQLDARLCALEQLLAGLGGNGK
jgi:hypothetical protein